MKLGLFRRELGIRFRAAAVTWRPPQPNILPGDGNARGARHTHQEGTGPHKRSRRPRRRGVRNPPCACRASWHRAVSCPSALVEPAVMRAMDRSQHTDDMVDADTPLAGRPSTVPNRLDRPVGKMAPLYAAMPSTTVRRLTGQVPTLLEGTIVGRAGGEHVYDVGTAR